MPKRRDPSTRAKVGDPDVRAASNSTALHVTRANEKTNI
jgi:hypothetical protein